MEWFTLAISKIGQTGFFRGYIIVHICAETIRNNHAPESQGDWFLFFYFESQTKEEISAILKISQKYIGESLVFQIDKNALSEEDKSRQFR